MSLQYIADSRGRTTGVFIPIRDWTKLIKKYKGLEKDEQEMAFVPEWQKKIVRERIAKYDNDPKSWLDFDQAMDDIEKEL